jgi:tetratricopeptide (TPR) repeat protein
MEISQVLNQLAKIFMSVTVLTVMGASAALAQAPQKQVKDQVEYDLYTNSTKETDPNKRLTFLNSWKEKYPDTAFKEERLLIYLTTYQQLNQPGKMVDTAKEIVALNPNNVNALMWLAYFGATYPQPPTADSLAAGESAAKALLNAPKPDNVDAAMWTKIKADFDALAHNSLGTIAVQRKQFDVAEQEYAKALQSSTNPPCQSQLPTCPGPAQISLAMANAIISQKKPDRYSDAIYELARAASLTGPGTLPDAQKKQVDAYLLKVYNTYHGADDQGLKDLRTLAVGGTPVPPPGFKIKDKNEIDADKQAEFAKGNPSLALWKTIRDSLTGPNGEMYFESSVKGAALPGGANGVTKFAGKLVSMKPALNPKELVLAISTPDTPEVTLKFETPLRGKADPGTDISFEGVASSFTKEPFMVVFDVESKDKIDGWPAQAAPPAKKRAPVHKKQ